MRKRENFGLIVLVILFLPVIAYKNVRNPSSAVRINWSWFLGPLVIPIRWAGRGWQATRRALGWDQLR